MSSDDHNSIVSLLLTCITGLLGNIECMTIFPNEWFGVQLSNPYSSPVPKETGFYEHSSGPLFTRLPLMYHCVCCVCVGADMCKQTPPQCWEASYQQKLV